MRGAPGFKTLEKRWKRCGYKRKKRKNRRREMKRNRWRREGPGPQSDFMEGEFRREGLLGKSRK